VHDHELQGTTDDLRAGLRVSTASIAWTVVSGTLAVVVGFSTGSLVLVAFGFTAILDAAGSAALILNFRHALHHDAISDRLERRALRVVTLGLVVVGSVTGLESVRRLVGRIRGEVAPVGLVLAALSIVVLALLSVGKRRIAPRIPSRALAADGWLSATGCLLAVVTVAGTGLAAALGWWWADPLAASVVALGAIGIAVVMLRE